MKGPQEVSYQIRFMHVQALSNQEEFTDQMLNPYVVMRIMFVKEAMNYKD